MTMFVIAALVGIVVGLLSGLLGIGGGTIMVPIFRLAFGLDPIHATATSLFTIIPTSVSGLVKHARNKTSLPRVGLLCGLAGACFSPVGVWAATKSPGWAIMGATALVIAYSSITMFRKALAAPKKGDSKKGGQPAGSSVSDAGAIPESFSKTHAPSKPSGESGRKAAKQDFPAIKLTPSYCAKVAIIGVIAGLLSGYVGVGGGFIMVPLFMTMLAVPMRLASGTSLIAVCILSIPGTIEQAFLGNIHFLLGIAMAAGSIPGAFVGASMVKKVPERTLRFIFAGFLLVMAVVLVANEFGLIG